MSEENNANQRSENAQPVGFFKADGTLDSETIVKSVRERAAQVEEQKAREAGEK